MPSGKGNRALFSCWRGRHQLPERPGQILFLSRSEPCKAFQAGLVQDGTTLPLSGFVSASTASLCDCDALVDCPDSQPPVWCHSPQVSRASLGAALGVLLKTRTSTGARNDSRAFTVRRKVPHEKTRKWGPAVTKPSTPAKFVLTGRLD